MVDGRESKKRQEKIFWRFFVSRPAVYRRFDEKLIPMSNDYKPSIVASYRFSMIDFISVPFA